MKVHIVSDDKNVPVKAFARQDHADGWARKKEGYTVKSLTIQ